MWSKMSVKGVKVRPGRLMPGRLKCRDQTRNSSKVEIQGPFCKLRESLGLLWDDFGRKVEKVAGNFNFSSETRKSPRTTCSGTTLMAISVIDERDELEHLQSYSNFKELAFQIENPNSKDLNSINNELLHLLNRHCKCIARIQDHRLRSSKGMGVGKYIASEIFHRRRPYVGDIFLSGWEEPGGQLDLRLFVYCVGERCDRCSGFVRVVVDGSDREG
ncbi:hypothetical protein OSB04_011500 [Centaurea solstitialis]|uniref:Uncharacterized protein n=1 Tax=Centaurea solstitialis TaxID=347529 RepID=A0AA38TK95_9ASTR|nr:hypothetical protein OSB04_011500 [Centaurea solstitialis]